MEKKLIQKIMTQRDLAKYLFSNESVMSVHYKVKVPFDILEMDALEFEMYANQIKGAIYSKTAEMKEESRVFVLLNRYLEACGKRINKDVTKLGYWKHLPTELEQ